MEIDAPSLAREMRRRKIGRPELIGALDHLDPAARSTTWVPCDLSDAPPSFLILAALSLRGSRPAGSGPR